MNSEQLLNALTHIDDRFLDDTKECAVVSPCRRHSLRLLLVAALIAALTMGSISASRILPIFTERMAQPQHTPLTDPAETVRAALEARTAEEAVLSMEVKQSSVDEAETIRWKALLKGSELAESNGWNDSFIDKNCIVVHVIYQCAYDHTKTYEKDGLLEQLFYLANGDAGWIIVDALSPNEWAA